MTAPTANPAEIPIEPTKISRDSEKYPRIPGITVKPYKVKTKKITGQDNVYIRKRILLQ